MSYRPKVPGDESPSCLELIGAVLLLSGTALFFTVVMWGLYLADRQVMRAITGGQ